MTNALFNQLGIDYAITVCDEANVVGSGERSIAALLVDEYVNEKIDRNGP